MGKIWVTSDTHFCHNRDFLYDPRGFDCVKDMDEAIVKNWNEVVAPDDEVYHLGDVMLCDNVEGERLLRRLNGRIHIIAGNHDSENRVKIYKNCPNVVEVCHARPLHYNGYHIFLSHFPMLTSNFDCEKPLKARTLSFCGHSHTSDPFQDWFLGPIYHVELDAHNNRPVSIDECLNDINNHFKKFNG